MSASEHLQSAQFFHGSDHEFNAGDQVLPQNEVGKGNFQYGNKARGDSVYVTPNKRDARYYGKHVYQVEPEGGLKDDPMEIRSHMTPSARVVRRTKVKGMTEQERWGD